METYARYIKNYSDYHRSFTWVKLSEAAEFEGVEINSAHRALSDCVLCARLIKIIVTKKGDLSDAENTNRRNAG